MKKIFTTILGIVLATCFVVSCEKDDSNNDTPNPPATAVSGPFTGANGRTIFFAKGNLYKDNGTYKIFPNQYDFVNSTQYDQRVGVDLFLWNENNGLNNSFSINGSNWMLPSFDDWKNILIRNSRPGATVNGTPGRLFAKTKIGETKGVMICPDNVTLDNAPQILIWNNDTVIYYNPLSLEDWQIFDNAGFVFLPTPGIAFNGQICYVGEEANYWSSTISNDTVGCLMFNKAFIATGRGSVASNNFGFAVRLIQVR